MLTRSIEARTLRPYQAVLFDRMRLAITSGHRDILLHAPPAAGKTMTVQALVAWAFQSGRFRLAVVLSPLDQIKSRWSVAVDVRSAADGEVLQYRARPVRPREAKSLAFWRRGKKAAEVVTACRADVCSKTVMDLLSRERPDLRGVIVIADEAHHHADTNLSGKALALLRELGATVLRSTGTPWHAKGQVKDADTVEVSLSLAGYARERDAKTGRPYAPQVWIAQQEQVDFRTDDEKLAIDTGKDRPHVEPEEYRDKTLDMMLRCWVTTGCPKTTVNLPRVDWAVRLVDMLERSVKARRALGQQPRVLNMAGKMTAEEKVRIAAVLAREAAVARYEDSQVDIIVSCARMNEGTDWPLCTDVYNVGVPGTLTLLIQRWCRASRSKLEIAGYPRTPVVAGDGRKVELRDVQRMTFFVPLLSDEARDRLWKVHHEHALLAACMLEDYEVGLQWAASVARPAEFGQALVERRPPGMERDRWIAVLEAERAEAIEGDQRDRAEALSLLVRRMAKEPDAVPYGRLAELAAQVGKGEGEDIAAALQSVTMGVLSRVAGDRREEIDRRLEDAAARVSKAGSEALPGRLKSAVRAEMRAQFEAIAAEFDVMVAIPPSVLRTAAVFSGMEPQYVANLLRQSTSRTLQAASLTMPAVRQAAFDHRAATGRWPTSASGRCDRLQCAWSTICHWLRAHRTSVRALVGAAAFTTMQQKIDAVVQWKKQHGYWPLQSSQEGKFLRALRKQAVSGSEAAKAALLRMGAPLAADRSDSIRRAIGAVPLGAAETARGIAELWLIHKGERLNKKRLSRPSKRWPWSVQDVPLERLDQYLSRGVRGCTGEEWGQVRSISMMCDEIVADCWRLWLDGADQPDPRPWADILAAGDNKRVVKAARVAYLDWEKPGLDGKPARRPWPQAEHPDLLAKPAAAAKNNRPKGKSAAKAQKSKDKADGNQAHA